MSVDGTPISQADLARIQAEEQLHAEQQRRAVQVIAATATDVQDCRTLLSMLGLGTDVVLAARRDLASSRVAPAVTAAPASAAPVKRAGKRSAA